MDTQVLQAPQRQLIAQALPWTFGLLLCSVLIAWLIVVLSFFILAVQLFVTLIEYGPDDVIVRVDWNGELRFQGKKYKVSSALHRHEVAVRPRATEDGVFDVFLAHHRCSTIDLNPRSEAS